MDVAVGAVATPVAEADEVSGCTRAAADVAVGVASFLTASFALSTWAPCAASGCQYTGES